MSNHWSDDLKRNKFQFIESFNKENPETKYRREFSKGVAQNPINMNNYKNVGGVERHGSTNSVIDKMISKQEIKRGQKINQKETKSPFNLNGINDDRTNKGSKFKVGME